MMFLWLSWGLTTTQNSIRTASDLGWSRLTDTQSAEYDRIGADTDPEYRIDASLVPSLCDIKGTSNQNSQFYHHLLTLMSIQTHLHFFLL